MPKQTFSKPTAVFLTLFVWAATAWLLYPFIALDSVDAVNVKLYLYRAIIGMTIMLIMFGKTIIDLMFPRVSNQKASRLNSLFLALYSLGIAGGIIFMVIRMIIVYMKSQNTGSNIF